MSENRIVKILRGMLLILLMAGGIVALLAAANRLPSFMQKDLARQYGSLEEVKQSLRLENVAAPAYFPEGISWPPSLIVAQKKPYEAVVMEFRGEEKKETVLIIIQSSPHMSEAQLQRIKLSEITEETQYGLKGRTAALLVGTCDNGMPCSRMTWQDAGLRYTVLLMSSPFELIKIAESMVR